MTIKREVEPRRRYLQHVYPKKDLHTDYMKNSCKSIKKRTTKAI